MNIIERQTALSKSLYEINANSLKETFSLQRENIEKYFETNREFGSRFPEVKDVSGFISLQREYGETLWNNAVEGFKAQSEIVKSAVENTGTALKDAFQQEETGEAAPETTAEEKPKAKAKAKPKARAKKATEAAA